MSMLNIAKVPKLEMNACSNCCEKTTHVTAFFQHYSCTVFKLQSHSYMTTVLYTSSQTIHREKWHWRRAKRHDHLSKLHVGWSSGHKQTYTQGYHAITYIHNRGGEERVKSNQKEQAHCYCKQTIFTGLHVTKWTKRQVNEGCMAGRSDSDIYNA